MHRDLKPSNIVLARPARRLKLIDFGLAKRFGRPRPADSPRVARLHSPGVGSPCYTAPEVVRSRCPLTGAAEYTEKADVYSAALIIWYLLTGRRPRRRAEPGERPDAGPARARWAEVAGVVERMWAGEAGDRPSAGECAGELEGLRGGGARCGGRGCAAQ